MKLNIKWLVFGALLFLCLCSLSISQQLVETKENRQLVARTQDKLSKKMTELATSLIVLATTQLVCLFVLGTQFKKTSESIQTDEVATALEGLDVSRILRKRDALSQSEMIALMKNLAQELREAKSLQEYLIERASHVVCMIDPRGKFLSISRASLSAWGYSPKELEGRLVGDIVIDGDRLIKSLLSVAKTQDRAVVETKLQVRDGELLEVIWTAHWSSVDDALFCIVQDVTERKRAEDQLRLLLDALPAGVLIASGTPPLVEFANGQACNLLRTVRVELNGLPLSEIWQYGFDESTAAGAEKTYQSIAARPDGTKFPVEVSTRSIDIGDELKQLFVFLDITAQQETEKLKNEFLAMVTHDLRTPLASLQGMLVLLDKGILGGLNDQGKRLSGKMSRDFDRLNRLINDMLDLEKVGSGKLQLECVELNMEEVVGHAVEVVRLHAITKGIALGKKGEWNLHCWGDRDQLVRVIVNLLSNALKYSPENSEITIGMEDLGTHARIAVADQGRGIPPEKIVKIFEKFEQSEIADAKKSGGTGLGLAICKAIVQEHGGQIGALNNREGGGSTFWFTVPKIWSEADRMAAAAEQTLTEIPAVGKDRGDNIQAS
jgi:two-component system sensor histidine kinase VicK